MIYGPDGVELPPVTTVGENADNGAADVSVAPPEGWEEALRAESPITTRYSHLRFFWYRARGRWILYDCVPRTLIHDDVPQGAPILGRELIAALEGPPPRDLHEDKRCDYVSDVQHEFYRLFKVYARPFWVLQGETGGHQVKFSPWQQNVLHAKMLQTEPPPVGSLPFAPFDNRVVKHLRHLNRLHAFDDRVEKLEQSGSIEAANAELASIQKEIRIAEAAFIEEQMQPVVDMATSLAHGIGYRSEYQNEVLQVKPGKAAEVAEAWDEYLETGNFSVSDVTGMER